MERILLWLWIYTHLIIVAQREYSMWRLVVVDLQWSMLCQRLAEWRACENPMLLECVHDRTTSHSWCIADILHRYRSACRFIMLEVDTHFLGKDSPLASSLMHSWCAKNTQRPLCRSKKFFTDVALYEGCGCDVFKMRYWQEIAWSVESRCTDDRHKVKLLVKSSLAI